MNIEIGLLIAIIGCFVGLAGWLSGRDKKISNDSEWRGTVNTKLDTILGINKDVDELKSQYNELNKELAIVKASASQAHKRIEELHFKTHKE